MGSCWGCGRELFGADYARSESCPGCDTDTRVCRNCALYDAGCGNDCREERAEVVVDKTRANFCEFFRPNNPEPAGEPRRTSGAGDAKASFEALFKKKHQP
ncbi:MAG: hypothetical protein ABII00_02070 [Elusimicrobiota bacterium]